jgi:tetratricopeptide (TPR) repeat protein
MNLQYIEDQGTPTTLLISRTRLAGMTKVTMQKLRFFPVGLLLATLIGCALPSALTPTRETQALEPSPAPVLEVPQGTAKELFREGIDMLQYGNIQRAKTLLQQVLVLEPNHKYARGLLLQIDADPVEMLGKENFVYKVQPGDSLSLIAKRFLGDPFKFYILGRYNDLDIFGNLEAGRSIKIPGKKPAINKAMENEQPTPIPTSAGRLSEAKILYKDGRFSDAIDLLEKLRFQEGPDAELDDLLLAVYAAHAKKLIDTGQFEEAKKLLHRALNIYPANERLNKQFDQAVMYGNAEQTYQEGNQLITNGELEKAYASYVQTLKLNREHAGAKAALSKIKPQVIEAYYADSVRARRRQKFTEALGSLDKLLEIDPNHKLAKENRLEIKAILDREQSGR